MEILRFITCGSVDDGKSTLIGRLLFDAGLICDDQLNRLYNDRGEIDYSHVLDGLEDEREQGITIDVAYRFFETPKRKFIVADCPGHEQYTRNMATGASTASAAVLLIDARKGLLTQTKRHSYILHMMGVRHYIVCVNKMDLVDYSKAVFDEIVSDYKDFASKLCIKDITFIPVSALNGDNVFEKKDNTSWYNGFPLLENLENLDISGDDLTKKPFRMNVQCVIRPHQDFRGFAGQVSQGFVKKGDAIAVMPSHKTTTIDDIVTFEGNLEAAYAGQSVVLVLADEIDTSRCSMLACAENRPDVSNEFLSYIMGLSDEGLCKGRSYFFKFGCKLIPGTIAAIKHMVDINNLEHYHKNHIDDNEFGYCRINLNIAISFEEYKDNRDLGSFIIIDRVTKKTVGMGLIDKGLDHNIHAFETTITSKQRALIKNQTPRIVWFTGLSGSGKSTISNIVEAKLYSKGYHTYVIDGDTIRSRISADLGFSDQDRIENIRRIGEIAGMFLEAGIIVLVAAISPFRRDRDNLKSTFKKGEFIEVFVDTPFDVCCKRDPKNLYKKADQGKLKHFTGRNSVYEPPLAPDIHLKTENAIPADLADIVIQIIESNI